MSISYRYGSKLYNYLAKPRLLSSISELKDCKFYDDIAELTFHDCYSGELPSDLPVNLKRLDLRRPGVSRLPELPHNLELLYCSRHRLTKIPKLPNTLKFLSINNIYLNGTEANKELFHNVKLPHGLKYFNCSNNHLYYIPPIPDTLETLICSNNNITYLPFLQSIRKLNFSRNNVVKITYFPEELEYLNCSDNNLESLPPLPPTLSELHIGGNPKLDIMSVGVPKAIRMLDIIR